MYLISKEQVEFLMNALAEVPGKISFQPLVLLSNLPEYKEDKNESDNRSV